MENEIYEAFDLMDKGQLEEAKALLDNLEIGSETDAYYPYLSTYGYIYVAMGSYQDALESYQIYLSKALAENNFLEEHRAYHQLAMVYREQKDYTEALNSLSKEKEVIDCHFSKDPLILSIHLYEVAYISHLLGDSKRAEELMEKSLNYALQTDDLIAQACSYRGLGEILSRLDLLVKSKKLFEEACDEIGAKEVEELMASI